MAKTYRQPLQYAPPPGPPPQHIMYGHIQSHNHPVFHPPPTQMQGRAQLRITKPSFHNRGKDKYGLAFTFHLPNTGQPVPMTWKKDNNVAVDGMKASRLSENNFELLDQNGQLMAVFTSHTMSLRLSAVGTLQINIDLGPMFEYAVITTLLSIYDFQKREEDSRLSSTSAAGAAAASSSC